MTVTPSGDIAIADRQLQSVKVFTSFGSEKFQFGGDDVFTEPFSITTDSSGRFLVLDLQRKRVTLHEREDGTLVKDIDVSRVTRPKQITFSNGKMYVTDIENALIYIYIMKDNDVTFAAQLTSQSDKGGHFLECAGVCKDRYNNLLIADPKSDRIHCLEPHGNPSYIIAKGEHLLHPTCIATSPSGLMAVAQWGLYIMENAEEEEDEECLELEESTQGNHVCIYRIVRADI